MMARKPRTTGVTSATETVTPAPASAETLTPRNKALVFISHDGRDSEVAEAFANLLSDVSVGTLKTFRSSDNVGTSGIAFGDEWYAAIISKLSEATDVVALLTDTSIDRPWILYEAGIAAGKLSTRVIGVAIGVPLAKAVTGPFSQFQNSADDEQSLTKLMMQLLQRNPDAAPRQETVAMHVRAFREKISKLLKARGDGGGNVQPSEEENIAKQVEEIKGLLRDLPDRVGDRTSFVGTGPNRRNRRTNMHALEEIAFGKALDQFRNGAALAFLTVLSAIKEDAPWLGEPGLEFYRMATSRSRIGLKEIAMQMHHLIEVTIHGPLGEFSSDLDTTFRLGRLLHELIERMVHDRSKPLGPPSRKT